MADVNHSAVGVASVHAINGVTTFADNTARNAYSYSAGDLGKVVRVGSAAPYRYYVIIGVSGSTATFSEPLGASAVQYIGEFTASAAQNLDITGLNGNTDETYIIEFYIVAVSGARYEIFPNGADPGNTARSQGYATNVGATLDDELILCADTATRIMGTIEVTAQTGRERLFQTNMVSFVQAANIATSNFLTWGGMWSDTTTNLTSIRLASNNASGFGAGSYARVWRRKRVTY